MAIKADYVLRETGTNLFRNFSITIASILTSGLLGEVYVGLEAGGDAAVIADGGRLSKTQSAVVLEKLIGQFLFDKASSAPTPAPGAPK